MAQSLSCSIFIFLAVSMSSFNWMMNAQLDGYPPMANLSSSWINRGSYLMNTTFEMMRLKPILLRRGSSGTSFVCGFYCNSDNTACLFGVLIFQNTSDYNTTTTPGIQYAQLVWSANRDNTVQSGATLNLTQDGDLILRDDNGTSVWSTNTGGFFVSGLNLTEMGNLVLFDQKNQEVWQSFDQPTDCLVPGQMLDSGLQNLTSNISSTDWRRGQYSLTLNKQELVAYIGSNPPQSYYTFTGNFPISAKTNQTYIQFSKNKSFGELTYPASSAAQFLKLDFDGHLRVYEWKEFKWQQVADLLTEFIEGECGYPMVCGKYGICKGKQCSCPKADSNGKTYFRENDDRLPDLGCNMTKPVSCSHSQQHSLFELLDTDYFGFAHNEETDLEKCKNNCLTNCSCKAAVFRHHSGSQTGNCSLLPEVYSLIDNEKEQINASAFIKVQNSPKRKIEHVVIIVSSVGALVGMFLIIGTWVFLYRKKQKSKEVEEDYLDQLPGIATRFSYENVKAMTKNFSRKLGEGGFGSVYEGMLSNGTKVAVKDLDGIGLVKKSFLAEVESIGSIHHINLVRLIGFCAEKSYRLLVYEYMSNSSLNKWIFPKTRVVSLRWQCRRKIIFDIAKGLAYLHEECRQKIYHLDIKPQNILLDENFNAKVADFGLSKLIDKDQSQVVTTMKGTPGYMAPEWLSSIITEKVDVYSFGVVVLEILCGRKNLDRSQPEEEMHLLSLFKRKAEEEQLTYIIDKYSENMQLHREEVVEMMRLAAWCLQSDFTMRPSMSVVVKVLEGLVDVKNNLDYNFMILPIRGTEAAVHQEEEDAGRASTPLLPSTLSGPR